MKNSRKFCGSLSSYVDLSMKKSDSRIPFEKGNATVKKLFFWSKLIFGSSWPIFSIFGTSNCSFYGILILDGPKIGEKNRFQKKLYFFHRGFFISTSPSEVHFYHFQVHIWAKAAIKLIQMSHFFERYSPKQRYKMDFAVRATWGELWWFQWQSSKLFWCFSS